MFIYHNYDMLLLAIQSLDPYSFDKLTNQSSNLSTIELFAIRTKSVMKHTDISNCHSLYYLFVLTEHLSSIISNVDIQHRIKEILQDISLHKNSLSLYSNATNNYIKRFIINYRRTCSPYLIGHDQYSNDKSIIILSIINLFLIYKLYEKEGIYFTFFYILHNCEQV
uniref:Uncharacterized protein n=1 Tax=Liagora brachyclada TaxID=1884665 RepID=A0A1G4P094_9FLOR|nr:Hypothetical protein ORF_6 [Liagora brachyclada]SCW24302.1 Hypothetical protein ORF_6 [Liagora brachyclada]